MENVEYHLQQLVDYTSAQLQAGQSPDTIVYQLTTAGWPADLVNHAFAIVQTRMMPTHMQAATAQPAAQQRYEVQDRAWQQPESDVTQQQPIAQQFAQPPQAAGRKRGRLAVGIALLRQSLKILNGNRYLLRYAVMTWVAVVLLNILWCVPIFFIWRALQSDAVWYAYLFLAYLTINFAVNYYAAAMAGNIFDIYRGVRQPYSRYIKLVRAKTGTIFVYSFISSIVNILLEYVAEKLKLIGWIISWIIGTAWSVGNSFTLPIIMDSDLRAGAAIKRSFGLFKQTWGESVVAKVTVNFPIFLMQLAVMIVCSFAFFGAAAMNSIPLGVIVGIIYLLASLSLAVAGSLANSLINVALYFYAVVGQVPPGYDASMLNKVFVKRKRLFSAKA